MHGDSMLLSSLEISLILTNFTSIVLEEDNIRSKRSSIYAHQITGSKLSFSNILTLLLQKHKDCQLLGYYHKLRCKIIHQMQRFSNQLHEGRLSIESVVAYNWPSVVYSIYDFFLIYLSCQLTFHSK